MDIRDRSGSGALKIASDFQWSAIHEFGHVLKLKDEYNTRTGLPTPGITSVMNARGTSVQEFDIINLLKK